MATGTAVKCDSCGVVDVIPQGVYISSGSGGNGGYQQQINYPMTNGWFDTAYHTGKRGNLCSVDCLTAWALKVEAESLSDDKKDS